MSLAQCLGRPILTLFISTRTADIYEQQLVNSKRFEFANLVQPSCGSFPMETCQYKVRNNDRLQKVRTPQHIAEILPFLLRLQRCESGSEYSNNGTFSRDLLSPVFDPNKRGSKSSSEGVTAFTFSGRESYKRGQLRRLSGQPCLIYTTLGPHTFRR